jgi:hypothetical protein
VFNKVGETAAALVLSDNRALAAQVFASLETDVASEMDIRRVASRIGIDYAVVSQLCVKLPDGRLQYVH